MLTIFLFHLWSTWGFDCKKQTNLIKSIKELDKSKGYLWNKFLCEFKNSKVTNKSCITFFRRLCVPDLTVCHLAVFLGVKRGKWLILQKLIQIVLKAHTNNSGFNWSFRLAPVQGSLGPLSQVRSVFSNRDLHSHSGGTTKCNSNRLLFGESLGQPWPTIQKRASRGWYQVSLGCPWPLKGAISLDDKACLNYVFAFICRIVWII